MATVIRGPLEFKSGHPFDYHLVLDDTSAKMPETLTGGGIAPVGKTTLGYSPRFPAFRKYLNANTSLGTPQTLRGGGNAPVGKSTLAYSPRFPPSRKFLNANTTQSAFACIRPQGATTPPFVPNVYNTVQRRCELSQYDFVNLLNTAFTDTFLATSYPESFTIQRPNSRLDNTQPPNLLLSTLFTQPTVTGTASITEQADILSATGTTTIVGSLSTTNSNDTSSASGTTTITGTSSTTNNNDTVSASGSVGSTVTGSANITEQADTVSAVGTTTIVGTSSTTNNNDTVTATGTTTITGTLSKTNNNDTVSASGFVGTPPSVTTYLPLTGVGH